MSLNELIFIILLTVLRGTALALQEEAARVSPHDGRTALQRIRFHVEGIGDPDSNRYWTRLRDVIIEETIDPAPQLTVSRKSPSTAEEILSPTAKRAATCIPLTAICINQAAGAAPSCDETYKCR
ncbi:hypothetical protein CYMTET_47125 [Cymbomonas tetramitiformis]|uniref:Uncharacterized protein n=1 Tax=Cymbomonas tetramitiformis TaxID=36881 RepID=A0AAE0BUV4_9CHLO|nr:hypothetical protein CYMTET_47125 [Cymbomonas tetramitiformis]